MRQLPVFRERCIVHPLRMNEEEPPVPNRTENMKVQATCLLPRSRHDLAQRFLDCRFLPFPGM